MFCELLIATYLTVCPTPGIEPIEFENDRIIYEYPDKLQSLWYLQLANEARREISGLPDRKLSEGSDIRARRLREETDERDKSRQDNPQHTAELGRRPGNIVDRVSYCESGQDNSTSPDESSASGYFQFIDSTWIWVTDLDPPASSYSFDTQLEAFLRLWDEGRGASHWQPSRYCWEHHEPWEHYVRP